MKRHDLVVIGAGPGGYVAAIRAAQLGMEVACVEKEKLLGGTCLRVGCIPSKALLESSERFAEAQSVFKDHGVVCNGVELDLPAMLKRKDRIVQTLTKGIEGLFKKHGITRYTGTAHLGGQGGRGETRITVEGDDAIELNAPHVIIAAGSASAALPGVEYDGDRIGSSTEALAYPEVPKHLVVIGAGYIGLELGSVWRRLGAEVTVLEYLPRILPGMDEELAKDAQKLFAKQGLKFQLGARVTGARVEGDGCVVDVDGADAIHCDRVLLAVGRKPYTEGLGLDSIGLQVDGKGRIPVNERYMTAAEGVYAIGDAIVFNNGFAPPMLAHKAEDEGVACAEWIATGYGHVNYGAIPGVCYTHPEIASVGRTEEALKESGCEYKKGSFPFIANGRARGLGETDGMVKILADAQTDRVLGVHILGPRAGDLIAEATAAMEFGATSEDIARTCHAHPTLAEVVKEAALGVDGRTIHI